MKKSIKDKNGGFYKTDEKNVFLDKRTGQKVSKKKLEAAYDWDMFGRKRPSDVIKNAYAISVTGLSVSASAIAGYSLLKRKGYI